MEPMNKNLSGIKLFKDIDGSEENPNKKCKLAIDLMVVEENSPLLWHFLLLPKEIISHVIGEFLDHSSKCHFRLSCKLFRELLDWKQFIPYCELPNLKLCYSILSISVPPIYGVYLVNDDELDSDLSFVKQFQIQHLDLLKDQKYLKINTDVFLHIFNKLPLCTRFIEIPYTGHITYDFLEIIIHNYPHLSITFGGDKDILYWCIWNNYINLVTYLIEIRKELVNKRYRYNTPLFLAITRGHNNLVDYLLKQGANPNLKNLIDNKTPLMASVTSGNINVFKLLLTYNVDITIKDIYNNTALNYAEKVGNKEMIGILKNIMK
jgi:ankyrin repeat protein